ncbi:hypothetical protein PMAYCL1PPCAC_09563, partial [Pristionchus mayeri]
LFLISVVAALLLVPSNEGEISETKMAEARSKVLNGASDHQKMEMIANADDITEPMKKDYFESLNGLSEDEHSLWDTAFQAAIKKAAMEFEIDARELKNNIAKFINNILKGRHWRCDTLANARKMVFTITFGNLALKYVDVRRLLPPSDDSSESQREQFKDLAERLHHIGRLLTRTAENFAIKKVSAGLGVDEAVLENHLEEYFRPYSPHPIHTHGPVPRPVPVYTIPPWPLTIPTRSLDKYNRQYN